MAEEQEKKPTRRQVSKKTVKKTEPKVEQLAAPLGRLDGFAGVVVSLNMEKQAYFGVGEPNKDMKLWLTSENWCAKVPQGLSESETKQIEWGLATGSIVQGKKWLPAVRKVAGTKESYADIVLKSRQMNDDAKRPFINLVRKESEGGYTALEILTHCLEQERSSRSRQVWIAFLQEAINHYEGPVQLVEDYPDDPENYEVFIDPNTKTVLADSKEGEKDKLKIDANALGLGVVPQQVASKELDKFLEG